MRSRDLRGLVPGGWLHLGITQMPGHHHTPLFSSFCLLRSSSFFSWQPQQLQSPAAGGGNCDNRNCLVPDASNNQDNWQPLREPVHRPPTGTTRPTTTLEASLPKSRHATWRQRLLLRRCCSRRSAQGGTRGRRGRRLSLFIWVVYRRAKVRCHSPTVAPHSGTALRIRMVTMCTWDGRVGSKDWRPCKS